MTLAELMEAARRVGYPFTTAWIPLKLDGKDVEITFKPEQSEDSNWIINLKIEKK